MDLFWPAIFGMILGGVTAWLYISWYLRKSYLPRSEVTERFVVKERYEDLLRQNDRLQDNQRHLHAEREELRVQMARLQSEREQLQLRFTDHQQEVNRLQTQSRVQFQQLADQLLEEKGRRWSERQSTDMQRILQPLRERLEAFEKQVDRKFVEETRDRVSLRQEIVQLRQLNQQLSQDANNLAGALRGDSKVQGDWGEWQLEGLLRASGLEPGIHYRSQSSFRDDQGKQKRPDFIVELPDDKQLIVDSKVSLTAYERYCSAEAQSPDRAAHLRNHLNSLRRHCRDLSRKNYTELYQINSPDYLLLFVPIEPAFNLAMRQDRELFTDALDLRVVIVTSSTLLATLRTVSYLWKQEKQKQHVIEIARQSGLLYDKFVNFVGDLREIGKRLDQSQRSYEAAMHKLSDGQRRGETLIGRAERLRKLGAKTKKRLPKDLLEEE